MPDTPAPVPEAKAVLAAGLAKALEQWVRGATPGVEIDRGWVRAVRIGGRRLRVLLRPFVRAGDVGGWRALRRALRGDLDGLSAARDREVFAGWFAGADAGAGWEPAELALLQRLGIRVGAGDASGGASPGAVVVPGAAGPFGAVAGEVSPAPDADAADPDAATSADRAAFAARLAPTRNRVVALIRAGLPEPLRFPPPPAVPGVYPGPRPPLPLPPWRDLKWRAPSPLDRRAGRVLYRQLARPYLARIDVMECRPEDPEEVHDLRRQARKFRYMLEALRYSFPGLTPLREAVKALQGTLGEMNDLEVVAAELGRRVTALADPDESGILGRGEAALRARLEAAGDRLWRAAQARAAGGASAAEVARAAGAISP